MNKLLIGIDASRAVASMRTGTEAYAYQLIRSLISLTAGQDYQIRLYFNQRPADDLFPKASHVDFCVLPFAHLWTHIRLANELTQRPPDIFFTPAHVIPFTYRGASVATVHDLGYHFFPVAHTRRQLMYLKWSTRHNGRISRRVIADSKATKADLIRFYNIDPSKIDVIYPGIDPQLREVTDENELAMIREKYSISSPYLLFISTLQPRKNLSRLIQAYQASGVKAELVLAGKLGWRSQPILEEIDRLEPSVRQRVHLTGFVDDADKGTLISGATALLYPSLYEGFGFPLLEAQTCGTPVLAANTSSLPEIAGNAALLVNPEDTNALAESMQRLAADTNLQNDLRSKGYANAQRFTWGITAAQVLQTLKKALVV